MIQLDDLAEAAEDLRRLGVDAWHQFMYGPHGGLEGLDVDEVFFSLWELCLPENREAFLRADFWRSKRAADRNGRLPSRGACTMGGERCRCFLRGLGDCLESLDTDAHLQACPKCRMILETTRRAVELCRSRHPCCVPPEVEARLMAALGGAVTSPRARTPSGTGWPPPGKSCS